MSIMNEFELDNGNVFKLVKSVKNRKPLYIVKRNNLVLHETEDRKAAEDNFNTIKEQLKKWIVRYEDDKTKTV